MLKKILLYLIGFVLFFNNNIHFYIILKDYAKKTLFNPINYLKIENSKKVNLKIII